MAKLKYKKLAKPVDQLPQLFEVEEKVTVKTSIEIPKVEIPGNQTWDYREIGLNAAYEKDGCVKPPSSVQILNNHKKYYKDELTQRHSNKAK